MTMPSVARWSFALVLTFAVAAAACGGKATRGRSSGWRVEPTPRSAARHRSHEHPHGAHPHPGGGHHHHPHPHPHLDGPDGHHHPY